jgi:outer membrane protein assembly factor BamA
MRLLLSGVFLLISYCGLSQNDLVQAKDSTIIIGNIIVSGNKKTKTNIILREMFVKQGDTISINQLQQKIEQSRAFIYNTTLFVSVAIETAKQDSNKISVIVLVKERWYIFPLPFFKLVDRNFNDWWVNQNKDLSRVNYGLKFYHNNLTGNNDKLNLMLITGYNRQIALRYEIPFINKKMTNGFSVGYIQSKQKELNYQTSLGNKQLFFKLQDGFTKSYTKFDVAFTNRPDKNLRHIFRMGYTKESIDDSVAIKNPNYYGSNIKSLTYLDFSYTLQYLNTNYNAYPTKGFGGNLSFYTRGLLDKTANLTQISVSAIFAQPISKKMHLRVRSAAAIKFPYNNIFINQPLFGYGDFQLRGQEYYVIDGMIGLISKLSLGYEMFDLKLKLPIKSATYSNIPVKIYGKVYGDFGYSHNPFISNDLLSNKLMHTYGLGLDIVTIYDIVIKLEYSFNQLGGSGFFVGN